MRHITILAAAMVFMTIVPAGAQTAPRTTRNLMPVPASATWQDGRVGITPTLTVFVAGHSDARLLSGIDRALRRMERRTGYTFPRDFAKDGATATLVITCKGPGARVPAVDENERYTLAVGATQAVLEAPTVVGALRGLETVIQLLDGDRDGYYLPAVKIDDGPRFPWRGLLIDPCRHWIPLDVIKRNIDGMAAVKLNVLHLHLTEDQGFRIESKRFPKLHQMGSDGHYFTQDQIRDLVAYAAERGIRVVPEFDMPGHVTAWLVGHPELASAPGPYAISRNWGIFDGAFDPTREPVYKFLDTFYGEMAALFPDAYMHIGGDENNGKQWNANPAIKAFMAKHGMADAHALQAYFNQRLVQILKKYNKRMVGWDEILHPDLPRDIMIQSWRGQDSLAAGARQGYSGILSNGYYIDLMQTAAQHYLVDPLPSTMSLTADQAAHVLGGEACMWAEWVDPGSIDSRIWPRMAAIAERFWSPGTVRDVPDMYRRLDSVSVLLEDLGLQHETAQPMMLRRMVGSNDVAALSTLAAAIAPVKGYQRARTPSTQFTPFSRVVDAARADPQAARQFAAAVDELLLDAPRFARNRPAVEQTLRAWRDIRPEFDRVVDGAPILREVLPLAIDLSALGSLGLEALSYLESGVIPPAAWRAASLATVDQAAKARADLELAIIVPMRLLIVGAAELGQATGARR
jgi:hexosaminidase